MGNPGQFVTKLAPAKINLALHVVGQRPDGYHLLETLCVFADFGDQLAIGPSSDDQFEIIGNYNGSVPADARNLVIAARDLVRARFGDATNPSVSIRLEKNLPVASGIGGGSSDAAAALILLNRHWRLGKSIQQLADIGISLGADIAMCLYACPLIASGIGEKIKPLANFPPLHLVLVNPGIAVPTGEIFSSLSSKTNPPLPSLPETINFDTLLGWLRDSGNDLQSPAENMVADITDARHLLEKSGAAFARMSGSGATCFGIYETADEARVAELAIATERPGWFVRAVETGASARG